MRRAVVSIVIAVLLVQPSLWALCAEHCGVRARPAVHATADASTAAAHSNASCHDRDRTRATDERAGVRLCVSAQATCPQAPGDAFEAQPFADATRPHAFVLNPASISATAAHLTPSPAIALALHDRAARANAPPRDRAPLVLRI